MAIENNGKVALLDGFKSSAIRMRLLNDQDLRIPNSDLLTVTWTNPMQEGTTGTFFIDLASNVVFNLDSGDVVYKIQVTNAGESATYATYTFASGDRPTFGADGTYTITSFKIEVS